MAWLDDVIADAEFPCETNSLTFCETLAAQYPKVIDYYLQLHQDAGQGHKRRYRVTFLDDLAALDPAQRA